MDPEHHHGRDRLPRHSDGPLSFTGSFTDAVVVMVAEVEQVLVLAAVPWECGLERRIDLRAMRAGLRGHLASVVAPWVVDDVLLVAVELVTNAYLHTRSPLRLRVSRTRCVVVVEVSDGDRRCPVLRPPSLTRLNGRGMQLVGGMSRAWGVRRDTQGGKTVWAELDEHPCHVHGLR
ncbi:ATP-binding protein [Umezawaea sp. Da 62-37]|uniref:ATP-binding protein n=1 Tax=Umezawaea sp. Da 62-37 TaxID=3075927 RepID=UPI0028F6CDE5|nr:ATP-binding protein [Umezawaea sp. Da 62-37]WNV83016.1 ATP-binding protein [Umezawaea sp. Da 62-37]